MNKRLLLTSIGCITLSILVISFQNCVYSGTLVPSSPSTELEPVVLGEGSSPNTHVYIYFNRECRGQPIAKTATNIENKFAVRVKVPNGQTSEIYADDSPLTDSPKKNCRFIGIYQHLEPTPTPCSTDPAPDRYYMTQQSSDSAVKSTFQVYPGYDSFWSHNTAASFRTIAFTVTSNQCGTIGPINYTFHEGLLGPPANLLNLFNFGFSTGDTFSILADNTGVKTTRIIGNKEFSFELLTRTISSKMPFRLRYDGTVTADGSIYECDGIAPHIWNDCGAVK